jgi:hypothetical protein
MNIQINPIIINGIKYVTVREMSRIINKSDQMLYTLLSRGNAIRKMKSIKIAEKILIPLSELTDFPFTYCGKGNVIYHYDSEGKIIDTDISVPYNIEYTNKDYPEDRDLENGNYVRICVDCGSKFVGHKKRIQCKVCRDGLKK